MRALARPGWPALGAVAGAVIAVDQLTKALVESRIEPGERVELLPFLDLVNVLNRGVAFGFLGSGSRGLVLAVTGVALIAVLVWFASDPARRWAWLAVGLIAGGAIGNLIDRLGAEGVTDFIDLSLWPSFNVADIAITFGAGTLVLAALALPSGDER